MHVRKNDLVQVMSGDDSGKTGKILSIMCAKRRVVVEGVNFVQKHIRKSEQNPQGGRMQKEAPISWSNVLVVCQNKSCEKTGQGVRVKRKLLDKGEKIRVCSKCGSEIIVGE
ncbi:MAG: 50S ribosomal protein L24 [Planctomycetes bacterium]|nr:50S ribosomal protein L24 [Planctomycetota bacterium]